MSEDQLRAVRDISGVVLASGMSRRFGAENKLLKHIGGVPVVRRAVEAYVSAGLRMVVVVIGHDAQRVGAAVTQLPVTLINNPDFDQGQSRSLRRGVNALSPGTNAAIIGVADQPFLSSDVIHALIVRFRASRARIVAPRYDGLQGNPVLFRSDLFPELCRVEGDQGGRPLLRRYASEIEWVDIEDARIGKDIDTPEQYAQWSNEHLK